VNATGLRDLLDSGQPLVGCWFGSGSLQMAVTMARAGFDYLTLDLEHSELDLPQASSLLRTFASTNTPVLVRVPWNNPYHIAWVLDHRATGVIVPSIDNADDAREMVRSSRLPPEGVRSGVGEGTRDHAAANRAIVCMAMIETREGVDRIDEILAVPGIDAVFVAPGDLATAYSMDWQASTQLQLAEHTEIVERILSACLRRQIPAAIQCYSVEAAATWRSKGFRLLNLLTDTRHALDGATRSVESLRAIMQ
jgi:4-hydroxy-2-oxoheptanedioate aldolase